MSEKTKRGRKKGVRIKPQTYEFHRRVDYFTYHELVAIIEQRKRPIIYSQIIYDIDYENSLSLFIKNIQPVKNKIYGVLDTDTTFNTPQIYGFKILEETTLSYVIEIGYNKLKVRKCDLTVHKKHYKAYYDRFFKTPIEALEFFLLNSRKDIIECLSASVCDRRLYEAFCHMLVDYGEAHAFEFALRAIGKTECFSCDEL